MHAQENLPSQETDSIPVTTVTFRLTEEDVARYQEEIEKFPVQDEEAILHRLPKKLKGVATDRQLSTFVVDLVEDVELLYLALTREEHVPEYRRKMILFALNYFIEAEDEIPDRINILGYMDDAVLIRWVVDKIKREAPEILRK